MGLTSLARLVFIFLVLLSFSSFLPVGSQIVNFNCYCAQINQAYRVSLNIFHGLTAIFSLVEAEMIIQPSEEDKYDGVVGMEYGQLTVTVLLVRHPPCRLGL